MTVLGRLALREAQWPYGDSCAFCHVGNHAACLETRWRVSPHTSDWTVAQALPEPDRTRYLTGGPCGCQGRNHAT